MVAAIADLQPQAYTGTPSFLCILLDKAQELGLPVSIPKALVSGEAFPPSLRTALWPHEASSRARDDGRRRRRGGELARTSPKCA